MSSVKSLLNLKVPVPVMLYAVLGVADAVLSRIAFSHGVAEGNPILDAALGVGMFDIAKSILTITILLIGTFLWQMPIVKRTVICADVFMLLLVAYHIFGIAPTV